MVRDTLSRNVSAGTSNAHVSAALAADVLEPANDAAQSAEASNSLEKMLCHQLAAAHFAAMRLLTHSANPDLRLQPEAVVRLTNAAARLMDVYQGQERGRAARAVAGRRCAMAAVGCTGA